MFSGNYYLLRIVSVIEALRNIKSEVVLFFVLCGVNT